VAITQAGAPLGVRGPVAAPAKAQDVGAGVFDEYGPNAAETFERDTPHVLVSDIRLPDADGYALLQRVRAADARRGRHTPAIALTAYPRVEDRARALEAGFQMHVPKPVAPDDLTAAIASLAGRGGGRS